MVRMTQKDAIGKWQVKGIPWERLREGAELTKETSQALYMCLCKLKDYEDTGMNPDEMESLLYMMEDTAGEVCDNLCHYRREAAGQEELGEHCESCAVSACLGRLMEMSELLEKEGK